MERTINCCVLTPEKTLFEGDINFAAVQAYDGEMGFLFNHAALLSELGIGEIRLKTKDKTDYLVVEGGIVEMRDNKLIILAESAHQKSDLDQQEIKKKMSDLESDLGDSEKDKKVIKIEMNKLKARLKVAQRS